MNWKSLGLVFHPADHGIADHYATLPTPIQLKGSVFRIFYSTRDQHQRSFSHYFDYCAETHKVLDAPKDSILEPGQPGQFDDAGAMISSVVAVGTDIYAYYVGWNLATSVPFRNSIGMAIGDLSGKPFTKPFASPRIDRSELSPCFSASPFVKKTADGFEMWFAAGKSWDTSVAPPKPYYGIAHATSADGKHWSVTKDVLLPRTPQEWALARPFVTDLEPDKMWLCFRGDNYQLGYAEKDESARWIRQDQKITFTPSGKDWDSTTAAYPAVIHYNEKAYLFYNGNGYGKTGIGIAEQINP